MAEQVDGVEPVDGAEQVDPYRSGSVEEMARRATSFRAGVLDGQVALVTGGAGGIGTAICVLLARLGARVVACGRDQGRLDGLQQALRAVGLDCDIRSMTVRDPEQVAALIAAVHADYGRLDLAVNSAGGQFSAPALDITPKGWSAVIDLNLNGTWYVMQAAARAWVASGAPGCIVNLSTITGRAAVGIPHTAASRAGAINLSKSLAVEWAPYRIRINSIAVGVIASEGLRTYPTSARPSFDHNPMRRLGDVWDIAEAVVYLAAPSGAFITGTVLEVAGGGQVWGEYWPLGKPAWFLIDEKEQQ